MGFFAAMFVILVLAYPVAALGTGAAVIAVIAVVGGVIVLGTVVKEWVKPIFYNDEQLQEYYRKRDGLPKTKPDVP